MEKGFRGKIVWKQALRPFQESFLEMEKSQPAETRPAFDITFYPMFQNISNVLQELHIPLKLDKNSKKFSRINPLLGFTMVRA